MLIQKPTHQLHTAAMKGFKSTDKKSVQLYISAKYQYLLDHKYEQRLQALQTSWNPNNTEDLDCNFQ